MNCKSIASIMLFAGSVLCFFLPFVTVSCAGEKVFTLSGQQMATGASIKEPQSFGQSKSQRVAFDPFVAVAGLCALAGVGLSIAGRRLAAAAAASGAVGTVSLGVMALRIDGQTQKATAGMGHANVEIGFILTLILFIAATAWNIYILTRKGRGEQPAGS